MRSTSIVLAVMFALFAGNIQAQDPYIELTFTGSFNGQHVALDSIKIINQSQVADTMLYGNDTVLRLEYNTGIGENGFITSGRFAAGNLYPNPFKSGTVIDLYVPEPGRVTAAICDLSGRIILERQFELLKGVHNFEFRTGKQGTYILAMTSGQDRISRRMVSLGDDRNMTSIEYHGPVANRSPLKNGLDIAAFPFALGDILTFIGFAATDSDTLQDNPTQNTSYEFIFTSGGFSCPGLPSIDYQGETYPTVQIGNRCWLGKNMNVGTMIESSIAQQNNEVIEKYCYMDVASNCDIYGGLYRWNEMMQYVTAPGSQGICPDGWHIPDEAEWQQLMEFLGGDRDAGGRMKETGFEHWQSPNTDATNQSGFTGLPGGQVTTGGEFSGIGTNGFFWGSSTEGFLNAKFWELRHNSATLFVGSQIRTDAKSVRCLKDQ